MQLRRDGGPKTVTIPPNIKKDVRSTHPAGIDPLNISQWSTETSKDKETLPESSKWPTYPRDAAAVPKDALRTFPHTKRVGQYLLGRTLGEGSFAKVKEGMHILTGEKVAVKVIDKKKAREDAYVRKNLRREARLLQRVRHTNVVTLLEVLETENSYYLALELCKGGDLMEHICSKQHLSENETRKYIRQIISAVNHLHRLGILHRDLKVENLLLDENKNIKIIDFGLSNSVRVTEDEQGKTSFQEFCVTQCGSPAYAAPELLGNRKYGPKVDVWSIGVNMYAMLTGNLPFTVEPFNIKALHGKMLRGEMNQIPSTLSKDGCSMLHQLLTPDPDGRISLTEAMDHPWISEGSDGSERAPFPNKLLPEHLNMTIIRHMTTNMDFRLSDVIRLVTGNNPTSATATYQLLDIRLKNYNQQQQEKQPQQQQGKSIRSKRESAPAAPNGKEVIELLPFHKGQGQTSEGNRDSKPQMIPGKKAAPSPSPRKSLQRRSSKLRTTAEPLVPETIDESNSGHLKEEPLANGILSHTETHHPVKVSKPKEPVTRYPTERTIKEHNQKENEDLTIQDMETTSTSTTIKTSEQPSQQNSTANRKELSYHGIIPPTSTTLGPIASMGMQRTKTVVLFPSSEKHPSTTKNIEHNYRSTDFLGSNRKVIRRAGGAPKRSESQPTSQQQHIQSKPVGLEQTQPTPPHYIRRSNTVMQGRRFMMDIGNQEQHMLLQKQPYPSQTQSPRSPSYDTRAKHVRRSVTGQSYSAASTASPGINSHPANISHSTHASTPLTGRRKTLNISRTSAPANINHQHRHDLNVQGEKSRKVAIMARDPMNQAIIGQHVMISTEIRKIPNDTFGVRQKTDFIDTKKQTNGKVLVVPTAPVITPQSPSSENSESQSTPQSTLALPVISPPLPGRSQAQS